MLASDRLGQTSPRIHEIRGILSVHYADPGAVTAAVRGAVHSEFEHVIDPKAGPAEQQTKLNQIHSGSSGMGGPLIRC